jgi:YVTN family beta-propeller protein
VYVAGGTAVAVIDTATGAVTGIPVDIGALDVAITPDGAFAYVTNGSATLAGISVIDTAMNTVVASVPVSSNPQGIAITPDGTQAYVANAGAASVQVLDIATNTLIATVLVSPGRDGPKAVAITPDGSLAYVTGTQDPQGSDAVTVIDTASQMVLDTVPVGTSPTSFQGIAITLP